MAELLPGDAQLPNGVLPPPDSTVAEAPAAAAGSIGAGVTVGSKRLRRPSVRLGDIGQDQYHHVPYDSQVRRSRWKPSGNRKDPNPTGKSSRTRTLTNLSSGYENSGTPYEEREGNVDSMAVGGWRVGRRVGATAAASTKRVRSNCVPKMADDGRSNFGHGDEKYGGEEQLEEDGYGDFVREDTESPMKEQSPVESTENRNERDDFYERRRRRRKRRQSSSRGRGERGEVELLSEPSEMEGGGGAEWRGGGGGGGGREGVKIWLEELGMGRYWPVFEIHEVDEEVLPLLTLEDLKDMGISAVGSRRKMYCAIQKLGREFS